MFEGFSFGAASRHPSSLDTSDDDYTHLSPTSSPPPHLLPEYHNMSISELSRRFSAQRIEPEYLDPYAPQDQPDWLSSMPTSPTSSPSGRSSPHQSIRDRRQAHTQWQCEAVNIRDLASLVEQMVESGDQCSLRSKSTSSSSSESGEDEDGLQGSKTPSLKYRRSGDLSRNAAVSKDIRFRRRPRKAYSHK
ncbi:uncharacterized protein K452DRAFT_289492 [Aplosporella prunicola CBS 121167]|uniref:Uncharacterized protein n=1 Tax=Aplosporella prunicola CBS 121167 TaxID=1176127 RepID=A0A6A6B853_9PEZI|nr:uncharacterized protein K452DRAFT_289492 [Aplosporella prunicola CBS 121167]KAF2140096.1 hypothetical protein K452DRAFT_289492 [Aplosporella prunicola CBS 121167]